MDLVLTSPPYYDALDYARDNRLRLWFLGIANWKTLDRKLIRRVGTYEDRMVSCLREIRRVLKSGKYAVLVVGESNSNGRHKDTAAVLGALAEKVTNGKLRLASSIEDAIPDSRRTRRRKAATRKEQILVFRKVQ